MIKSYKCIGSVGRMWGNVLPDYWVDSYVDMINYNNRYLCKEGEFINYIKATVSWHEMAQNQLVNDSLGEWLLMLGTDHTFSPDLLDRLLFLKNKYKASVISGIYQYKFQPHAPVINLWASDNTGLYPIEDWDRSLDIMEVGVNGAGCLLADRKVYLQLMEKYKTGPFTIIQGLSEDYSFCKRCRESKIPIYVAPKVECHHVINHVLSVNDYIPLGGVRVKSENGEIKEDESKS